MGRHQRIMRQNPYINRYGGRTRYMPNRAKDPARRRQAKPIVLNPFGPMRGSGRNADLAPKKEPEKLTEREKRQIQRRDERRERREAEQQRIAARYGATLPKLIDVIGKVRDRLMRTKH